MSEELYTVDFAAERLKLHPKTVLRFIREGRLRATRVGKSYRILRSDLDALAGLPAHRQSTRDATMTCIVDIPELSAENARAWASMVPSALNSRPRGAAPLRADVIYDPARSHLKIIIVGAPNDALDLMSLIRIWLERLS